MSARNQADAAGNQSLFRVMSTVLKSVLILQAGHFLQPLSLPHLKNYHINSFFSLQTFCTFPHFLSHVSLRKQTKAIRWNFLILPQSDPTIYHEGSMSALPIVRTGEWSPASFQTLFQKTSLTSKDFDAEINHLYHQLLSVYSVLIISICSSTDHLKIFSLTTFLPLLLQMILQIILY